MNNIEYSVESIDIKNNYIVLKYKLNETDNDFSYLTHTIPVIGNQIDENWKVDIAIQIKRIKEYSELEKNRIELYEQLNLSQNIHGNIVVSEQEINDRIEQQNSDQNNQQSVENDLPGLGFIEEIEI